MPDEITIRPKSESATAPASPVQNQTANLSRAHLVNLCAAGLGVSFFLPWVQFFGDTVSGFDLQKLAGGHRLLWLIPICCVITIFAGAAKRSQKIAGAITGTIPLGLAVYCYHKVGNDLFQQLFYGAYLSLAFGAVLFILPGKSK
jgi:hypothetical protein